MSATTYLLFRRSRKKQQNADSIKNSLKKHIDGGGYTYVDKLTLDDVKSWVEDRKELLTADHKAAIIKLDGIAAQRGLFGYNNGLENYILMMISNTSERQIIKYRYLDEQLYAVIGEEGMVVIKGEDS